VEADELNIVWNENINDFNKICKLGSDEGNDDLD